MAKTVKADLRVNVRDEDGTLYRAGRGREIPAALAERLGVKASAKADETGTGGGAGTDGGMTGTDAGTGAGTGDGGKSAGTTKTAKTAKGKGK